MESKRNEVKTGGAKENRTSSEVIKFARAQLEHQIKTSEKLGKKI